MARGFVVAVVALAGLLCAAAIGYAAYTVSRGSVAVPVTRLQPKPTGLAPAQVRQRPRRRVTTTATVAPSTSTTDDHGGGDHSGHGGGGGGDD